MNNFSAEEIAKFDSNAFEWWEPNGAYRLLHALNPLRMDFIGQHSDLAGKMVLDVGCGGGILSESLACAQASVKAIDLSLAALNVAKLHALEQGLTIDYQQQTVEDYAQHHQQQFDIITCMEMLEHVPDVNSILAACQQLLKPNGILFLSTLNRNLKSYLLAILAAERIFKWLPVGTHDYQKFIQPHELAQMCRHNDFHVLSAKGISYQPLLNTFELSDDVSINYLLAVQLGSA